MRRIEKISFVSQPGVPVYPQNKNFFIIKNSNW